MMKSITKFLDNLSFYFDKEGLSYEPFIEKNKKKLATILYTWENYHDIVVNK